MTTTQTDLIIANLESYKLSVRCEVRIRASLEVSFAALLEQLGPANERPDGTPMPLRLEAWPGGRWFRDLGDGNGHFWGHVQAIHKPDLLEITGPLFMSYPVANNVQYRLRQQDGVTVLQFHHQAFGLIEEAHRQGVLRGWDYIHEQARLRAESSS